MWEHFSDILRKAVNLKTSTDIRGTIDSIRNSITIKGYNMWILACGAILASIGLDTNSPAIIIGAMLISPLMSPILGIGLSIGINDRDSLVKSLENYVLAVFGSLLMSTLYFLITPLGDFTPEMDSRTHPTLLDVGVAFFGGVAGIVAGSRKDKTNAIPGVAIATALMPPLCTAGYGLAKGCMDIFGGAFYLFFINSVFIALSTYLIVRMLRFPFIDFVDDSTRKKVQYIMIGFAILTIVPSVFFMINVIGDLRMNKNIKNFIEEQVDIENVRKALNHELISRDSTLSQAQSCPTISQKWNFRLFSKESKQPRFLKLYMTGTYIDSSEQVRLNEALDGYNIPNCSIKLTQNLPPPSEDQMLDQVRIEVLQALTYQEEQIDLHQQEVDSLNAAIASYRADTLPFQQLQREIRILYPEIREVAFAKAFDTRFEGKQDTLPILMIDWGKNISRQTHLYRTNKLEELFTTRFQLDTLKIVRLN
ncbi:MAG: DUF389 domain-containing protein [Bacteroidota bacterium]